MIGKKTRSFRLATAVGAARALVGPNAAWSANVATAKAATAARTAAPQLCPERAHNLIDTTSTRKRPRSLRATIAGPERQ